MSNGMIDVLPQPRIDQIIEDVGGVRRRRTEYSGTVWFGGTPRAMGSAVVAVTRQARVETPFFLPDSLAYRADGLTDATLSITTAVESLSDYVVLHDKTAAFVTDPSGAPVWIQVQVLTTGRVPLAVSYRVVAVTAPDAA